jgi:cytochrome c-type biogenesis protein CcmH/NrfG
MTPELVKKDSLTRLGKNPGDASEYELLAWANWKLGRKDEARQALSQARRLRPNDPSIEKNWAVVNRPNSQPEDFKIQIQLGMGFDDLLK